MSPTFESFALIVLLIWLITITFFVFKFYLYYSHITEDGKKESLLAIIDSVLEKSNQFEKEVANINKKYDKIENNGLLHIQKVGLLRFNPFKDTGGDQSFILALLDAHDTGVMISSLHTRSGTRWYAKRIVEGKGQEYNLSEDEKKALAEARFLTKE